LLLILYVGFDWTLALSAFWANGKHHAVCLMYLDVVECCPDINIVALFLILCKACSSAGLSRLSLTFSQENAPKQRGATQHLQRLQESAAALLRA